MNPDSMAALFLTMTTLALIPSTSVLVVVANSIASGFKHGALTALGILCGDFIFILLAVYGLSAIANSLASLFMLLRYLGAAYLLWMGSKLWSVEVKASQVDKPRISSYWSSFTSGLFITLADFKAIFFYVSFFPAFLDLKQMTIADLLLILMLTSVAVGGVKLGYAYLAAKAKLFISNPKAVISMNRLAGTATIAVAVVLIAKS